MKYVRLGDRQVSAIGLGLGNWGGDFDECTARAIVTRALELGINFFDTAELYGSEGVLGHALAEHRDTAIVATKVNNWHLETDTVVAAAEGSRQRLNVDSIDLYQIHWPNFRVPLQQTMSGMQQLLGDGRIRSVGVCNFSRRHWQKAEAALGQPVHSNQLPLSLVDHASTENVLPYTWEHGRVVIAYWPLAQGLLSARYLDGRAPNDFRASMPTFSPGVMKRAGPLLEELRGLGRKYGATPAQIALAWVLRYPQVVAIPGANSVAQVEQNAHAASISLTDPEWRRLRKLGRGVRLFYPRRAVKAVAARALGY
jgi:aryl-alcohol dehydrogenase-like predicted oxidoreductase